MLTEEDQLTKKIWSLPENIWHWSVWPFWLEWIGDVWGRLYKDESCQNVWFEVHGGSKYPYE